MSPAAYWTQRVTNGLRKIGAGLRPFGESVWPGVRNDLFVAHESLYLFATRFASGVPVLDAGCGTGYGSALLAAHDATSVLGLDIDRFSIAFASRRYRSPSVSFRRADLEAVALPSEHFGLIFCSNALEHLSRPPSFLAAAFHALRPGGRAIFAVPPIVSAETLSAHRGIHYHRSNLTVAAWSALVGDLPWSVTLWAHRFLGPPPWPDFRSPFPSSLRSSQFGVEPSTPQAVSDSVPTTVLFLAERTT